MATINKEFVEGVAAALLFAEDDRRNPGADHFYPSMYTDENGCHCLIGEMVVGAGGVVSAFWGHRNEMVLMRFRLNDFGVEMTEEGQLEASALQRFADGGVPWWRAATQYFEMKSERASKNPL